VSTESWELQPILSGPKAIRHSCEGVACGKSNLTSLGYCTSIAGFVTHTAILVAIFPAGSARRDFCRPHQTVLDPAKARPIQLEFEVKKSPTTIPLGLSFPPLWSFNGLWRACMLFWPVRESNDLGIAAKSRDWLIVRR
jgi:hypothetical protein